MSGLRVDEKGVLTACAKCGTTNRQAFEHLGQASRCGKCQAELPPPAEPVTAASSTEFDRLVSGSRVPVLVDFWAPWCGPCRAVAPELQKVARFLGGRLVVAKVNTDEVEDSPLPVLVDFWAPWCGPCRAVGPVLEQLATERAGRIKVVKVNVDENPRTASLHGIRSIPALFLFRGPLLLDQQLGALPKPVIESWLERFI